MIDRGNSIKNILLTNRVGIFFIPRQSFRRDSFIFSNMKKCNVENCQNKHYENCEHCSFVNLPRVVLLIFILHTVVFFEHGARV